MVFVYFCDITRGRVTNLVGRGVMDRDLYVVYLYFCICIYLIALFSGALVRSLYCCAARHFGGRSGSILYGTH